MEMQINQAKFSFPFYNYKIYSDGNILYTAKKTQNRLPSFVKIYLYDTRGNELYCLKQRSIFRLMLSYIPIVNFFINGCSYILYSQGTNKGFMQHEVLSDNVIGCLEGNNYELYQHTGDDISIFCNKVQVGFVTKNRLKFGEADKYKIEYSKHLIKKEILALLVLLADAEWPSDFSSSTNLSWEYTIKFGEKKRDLNWIPDDNSVL